MRSWLQAKSSIGIGRPDGARGTEDSRVRRVQARNLIHKQETEENINTSRCYEISFSISFRFFLISSSAVFQFVSHVSREFKTPPFPPFHTIAREEEKGGKRDAATHFSRFNFGFLTSFTLGFYLGILFPKGELKAILPWLKLRKRRKLTTEVFHRTKEEEFSDFMPSHSLSKPHFPDTLEWVLTVALVKDSTAFSSNAKRFSCPWVIQFKSLVSAATLFQRVLWTS